MRYNLPSPMPESTETTSPPIDAVWIVEGCIICGLCEDNCPEVFDVRPGSSVIRQTAERHYRTSSLQILKAVAECPVDVIKVRLGENIQ